MNVAILIGVSKFKAPLNDLLGCKKDIEAIKNLIDKTEKFDEVICLDQNQPSALVKEKLTDFISEHKTKDIEELFFYFTGHGEFHNDEFYFLLSDFDQAKRKQTSLQNDEIDTLIKTLNPHLVVKTIDACQSGKSYIKDTNGVSKYFEKTQNNFDKCYFLNSSLNDQSSYISQELSDFTTSFIDSISNHQSDEIRYKDIMDYISDEFESNPNQTPFFVIQADYTEKFCTINKNLRGFLQQLSAKNKTDNTDLATTQELTILEQIKLESAEYCTKEEAIDMLDSLKHSIEKFSLSDKLKDIFDLSIYFYHDYNAIIEKKAIGSWLKNNEHDFFAKPTYQAVQSSKLVNRFLSGYGQTQGIPSVPSYDYILEGFEIEVEVPYQTIVFNLDSKFPNVRSFTSRTIFFISKRKICFFNFVTNFEEKNWDNKKLNADIDWFRTEYPITNFPEIESGFKQLFDRLENSVMKELNEIYNVKKNSEESKLDEQD